MNYKVNVVYYPEEISDKEKSDRLCQFQKAFVNAAVSYYSDKFNHLS